jgi:dTDP-L-rhamnose 4-epimerase
VGQLASALADSCGGPDPVITGEYRLGDVRHITASSERIRRELGWQASVPFTAGVAEFASAPAGRVAFAGRAARVGADVAGVLFPVSYANRRARLDLSKRLHRQ